ncbi:chromate transporter [Myroides sp. 1354]|uniref:chromate transporter n=1 Tax=unclassified Myroides TaxID=2642485 RepID=UPI002578C6F9|nr:MULTISPECIES: chromate transporter [unclassified Myroides]MDM1044629.1 chromate transporter [Myroides sp. R163-1]MDM1055342.1 chromate transporter [Myroides sp. 1354]MDM1068639.1 chromate transporter [Myroides sp. 1372]
MLFKLFFLFTKIGIFTIGGGYAVIPLIEKEIISRSWLTYNEFYELLAITESLPGVFATNIAALVGFKIGGIKGGILAALGTIIAPFVIVLLVAVFFNRFQDNVYVAKAFKGLRPVVVALIAAPCYTAIQINKMTIKSLLLPLIALLLMWGANVSPIWIILGGCLGGILYHSWRNKSIHKA